MSFDVKRADVDTVGAWIISYAAQVGEQISMVNSAAQGIASLESFQGAAADNIKSYWGEMHVTATTALSAALSELAMRYAAYMDGYGGIDSARDARFEESTLTAVYTQFASSRSDLAGKDSTLRGAVNSVSDLIGGWTPSTSAIDSTLAELADNARDLRIKVSMYEGMHLANASACDALASSAGALVASLGSGGTAASYVPGSISTMPWAQTLSESFAASATYQQNASAAFESSLGLLQQRMQERYDEEVARLAKEREKQGEAQTWIAGAALLVGTLVIVFSASTATPLVVGLFVAAGAFQASNLVEGIQNWSYGSNGDITTLAFNPLRDTVFLGNEQAYGFAEFAVTAAAGAAMPASAAIGAARATGTSVAKTAVQGAKTFGYEVVKDQAIDVGLTITVDPIIRRTLGDGVSGQVASAFIHQSTDLIGIGGKTPSATSPGHYGKPGSPTNPIHVNGINLPDKFFKGPFDPVKTGLDAPTISKAESIAKQMQAERIANKTHGKDIDVSSDVSLSERRAEQLKQNVAQGAAYAQEKFAAFKARYPNALSEVTIELDDGTRIRVDAIAVDENGNIVIEEYKSSTSAPLTKNQKHAYIDDSGIMQFGGKVVGGKGVGTFGEGIVIEPGTIVKVIRPD